MLALLAVFTLPARAAETPAADPAAAAPDKTPPDVIIFTNGDQLTGKFLRATGGTVAFHSDIAGDINVGLDKVKELRSSKRFAVFEKGLPVTKAARKGVPTGTITVKDEQIQLGLEGGQTRSVPVKNADYIIDEVTFNRELRREPGFLYGWVGGITGGVTEVQATQNTTTFTLSSAVSRTIPTVNWLNPSNRTLADFSESYGKITTPSYLDANGNSVESTFAKTSIMHADAERDQYFSPRMYALVQIAFDHNYSQGLDLQQIYGGGIGWTVIKRPKQTLDLKATVQYERQAFMSTVAGANQDLIGSTFAADYVYRLPRGMVFNQQFNYIPAYNNSRAYSANEVNSLTMPFYKRLGLTIGTMDSYLNNPPLSYPPTKRNSFQFTTGVTYTLPGPH